MMGGEWQMADGKLQIAITSYKLVMCFTLALTDHLLTFDF
jgi:hypothetical protein